MQLLRPFHSQLHLIPSLVIGLNFHRRKEAQTCCYLRCVSLSSSTSSLRATVTWTDLLLIEKKSVFWVRLSPPESTSFQGGPAFNRIMCSQTPIEQRAQAYASFSYLPTLSTSLHAPERCSVLP